MCEGGANVLFCVEICLIVSLHTYTGTPLERVPRVLVLVLEYQAMPSLRDVARDGWLCTLTI